MRKSNELQIGKAGEYLVCADLIMKGYVAFISEQGLPYDVILDNGKKMYRVQVKSNSSYKRIPQRSKESMAYIFNIKRKGKNGTKKYSLEEIDIFALVALDIRMVAYLKNNQAVETMNFRVPSFRGKYYDEQGSQIKKKVMDMRADGLNCETIASILHLKKSNVHKYSADVDISQIKKRPVYIDEFSIERCF